jgi:hypothetical protein
MDLKLSFLQHNLEITVELLDLPIIRIWAERLIQETYSLKEFRTEIINVAGYTRYGDLNKLEIKSCIDTIQQAFCELEEIGYRYPDYISTILNKFQCLSDLSLITQVIEQQDLNKLHRFFTENWRWCYIRGRRTLGEPNPFDPTFNYPEHLDTKNFFNIIDKINVSVHNLEEFLKPESTKRYVIRSDLVSTSIWVENKNVPVINLEIEEYLHNYRFALDQDDYPVVLPAHILGKSVMHSYLDNDYPLAQDCLGRSEMGLQFLIDIDKNRRKLYNSPNFNNWVSKYNITPSSLPLEFQLGRIKDSNLKLDRIKNILRWQRLDITDISLSGKSLTY